MAKKWSEVAASEGFKALSPDQQDGARRQYFDDVVAPQVPTEHIDRAWDQFSTDVGVGRRALPKDVAPSLAGAGRGTTMPTAQPDEPQAAPQPVAAEKTRAQRIAEMDRETDPANPDYLPITDNAVKALQTDARGGMDAKRTRSPGRVLDADLEPMTPTSVARDVVSGAMQIPGVVGKGVGELARMATGDRVGKGLSEGAESVNKAIRENVGSWRAQQQDQRFQQDMQDPALNAADYVVGNPGALADQLLPTIGSMALPIGAANVAGKLATGSKAAQLARVIDEGTVLARAERAREAAVIGTTVAQNAADTYSTVRDEGGDQSDAYKAAGIAALATAAAGKLTGGGAEANAAHLLAGGKGAVKAIPKAMAKEGAQEMGEEAGQYAGETVGTHGEFDANTAGKRLAVAGTLGAAMGGGVEGLGAARAARESRIKTLRDAGETAAADLMQQKHDKATAAENVDAELAAMPGNETFAQHYRTMRTAGVKPAEAAARSAVTVTFQGLAQETGVPPKAMQAAMTAAQGMPLDKVPGFLHKFADGLAKRGLVQPSEALANVGTSLEAARDEALDAAMGAVYAPVKSAMSDVQALESSQNQALAPVESAQAATETIANVQDPTQATGPGTEAQAAPSQAPTAVGSDAASTQGVPGAASPDLQTAGVGETAAALDLAAHDAATSPLNNLPEPTQAQKEAGNYKVGRVNLHGLNISVENPEGSVRKGIGDDGKPWENTLAAHYGYIRGTEGNDGDHVDTFIGPNPQSDKVFVVDQVNKDGSFDEHKVMLGTDSLQQADDLYHANYHAGWTGRGAITEMSMTDFKKWVKDGTKTQPVAETAQADAGAAPADGAPEVQSTESGATSAADSPVYLGHNNTPIAEGGKPFKTRKAADDARKLNPMMRVVRTDGGYSLTEKTPAQLAAQEKAAKRLRNPQTSPVGEPIPAHAMIAAAGGLHPDTRADMGIQGNVQIGNRKLFAGKGKGMSIERATERLVEEGYLQEGAGHDQARDLIKRSLTKPQYNAEGTERMAAAEIEARMQAQQEAIADIEHLNDNEAPKIDDADIPWDAPVGNTSTEAAMRALGFTDQEIADAIANESRVQSQDSQGRGIADEGAAAPAQTDLGRGNEAPPEDPPSRSDTRRQEAQVIPEQTPAPAGVSVSAFATEARPDGTLAVKGDAAAIRESLKEIPARSLTPMKGGILVGRTQADKAMAILQPAELSAPTKQDVLDQQARTEQAAKDKEKADRAADKQAREADERKRIAKASEAAADSFELGGDVQKAVDQLTAKWKDGPRIKVVLSPEELPVDAPSDARGLIHKGTAYIVAGNHLDRAGVARTLAHEAIGHYGLWKMLGTDGTRQFERNVQLALKSGNKPLNAIAARVRELYVDEKGKFNLSPAEEANEIAAFAVEEALDADGNFKPGFGFLKQVWSKLADFLRSIGIDVKFTNAELQGMLVSSMRGLEAGKRLEGGGESLVAAARDVGNLPEQNALREISGNDEMFQYPVSYMDTVEGITADIAPHIKVRKLTNIPGETRYVFETPDGNTQRMMVRPHNPYANEDAPTIYGYDLDENHEMTGVVTDRPGKNPEYVDGKDDVYVDVSLMRPGERGSAIYAIAANYAHNTGKVFIGDPAGLSDHAMKRRVEQMLSSALKFGTTDHLAPHPRQVKGDMSIGVPALNWTYGDDLGNIKSLIRVSNAIYGNDNPITFEPVTGRYLDSEGVELDDDAIRSIARIGRGREAGAGLATLKRNAVLSALVSKGDTGSDRTRGRDQLLEKLLDVGREFPAATSRIFYARGVTQNLFAPTVWNTPDPTRTDKIIYELQDGRVDLKRVQQAIEKSGQQIEEKWDARLAETLYPGRVAYRSQKFLGDEVKPLLKSMATYGVKMDELADYLHARGAEERNAQVAKVNDQLPDGGAGKNTKGVLMTNQAARDYLANITPGRKQLLDMLAAKVDAITAGTRSLLVNEGLEKQDTIDAWTKAYKNYVPMFRDEAQSGAPHPQGSGFTVKGSASKRATGSTKEVTNILAHVLMQREAAITRAEKNRVALSLYGQALSHPNPDFWTTIKPSMTAAAIGKELQAMGVDPATAAAGMEMVPTITSVDPNTGKKVDRPNPLYKSLPGAIPLKVNGEDRVLMLNTENERGARLAENLKNLDGLTKLDLANTIIGKATRWLAAINTQYNPAFGLVNLTRDTLGGSVNLGSTELRGNALKVLAQTPTAVLGIARELANGGSTGKWQTLYRQFQADGGQTGYKENWRDAGDRAKAVEKELAALQRAGTLHPARAVHAILDLLDGFNTTLENAVRLSAYKTGLDNGMSGPQAARLGRELTVDFNRKGRAGREVGPLYAFFNAAVQGLSRGVQTLKGPTGAKVIAGGLGLGILQALMLAAAGYDDDEIPEFVKTRALIIPLPGKEKTYVAIPYPLELQMVPNTARVLTELALNGGKDVGKRVFDAVGTIAGSFNPLGGGNIFTPDGALKTVAPSVIDPLIELGFNRNFAGNSIERAPYRGETDTRPGVARTKESTQRSTTGQAYMGISKAINSLTGGTDYEAGAMSPTPERLRYLAQTVGGGVLREIEKTVNASTAAARGDKVKMSQIPVAGRFYGEVDGDQVKMSRYFENRKDIQIASSLASNALKAKDRADYKNVLANNPKVSLVELSNDLHSDITELNKLAVTTTNDAERIKKIDGQRLKLMDQLNQAVKKLEQKSAEPTVGAKIKGWKKEAVTP